MYGDHRPIILPLEGKHPLLMDKQYTERKDAVAKCYQAAKFFKWKVFAVSQNGMCRSDADADLSYNDGGQLPGNACAPDGRGGAGDREMCVYRITDPGTAHLGTCYYSRCTVQHTVHVWPRTHSQHCKHGDSYSLDKLITVPCFCI
jgi:hypothetical protein